jgi:hypothetical protein
MVRRLLNGKPTVYCTINISCFLFDYQSNGRQVDLETLINPDFLAKRKLWILTDEALDDARWNDALAPRFIVLAASPKMVKLSTQWEKGRNISVQFMSNWGWYEIVAAFR